MTDDEYIVGDDGEEYELVEDEDEDTAFSEYVAALSQHYGVSPAIIHEMLDRGIAGSQMDRELEAQEEALDELADGMAMLEETLGRRLSDREVEGVARSAATMGTNDVAAAWDYYADFSSEGPLDPTSTAGRRELQEDVARRHFEETAEEEEEFIPPAEMMGEMVAEDEE
jgi:hypothetical protein